MSSMLYSPPAGFYDLPFSWCYDASALTDGKAYPNQFVYLQGGYGDFILRRIVGLSRILDPTQGQYQIRDRSGDYIEQEPVFGSSADDIGLAPELPYREKDTIRFDLGAILRPAGRTATSQIAFQGVRRLAGAVPRIYNPDGTMYNTTTGQTFKPKHYIYTMRATVASPVGGVVTARLKINDFDFELYQVIILQGTVPAALATPVSSLWLYDSNKVQISSAPLLDLFIDGGPGGVYRNGAIVTPLYYPQNAQIQVDFYSQLTAGSKLVTVYFVGKQWYPTT